MSNKRIIDSSREETLAMKKIQSIIKGWMTLLEEMPEWEEADNKLLREMRRAVVRGSWDSYKVGLMTPYVPDEDRD